MNQQPDKLFRERLEGFQKPAPASAWDKIETNLDKKSPAGLWWKIAASLLLFAVASYMLWPKTQTTEKSLAKKPEETKPLPTVKENEIYFRRIGIVETFLRTSIVRNASRD